MSIIEIETKEIVNKIKFDDLKNSKILITGASGLIGVYLISCLRHLIKTHNLEIYTWVKNDIDPSQSEFFNGCKLIKGDICDEKYFNDLPNFDLIIHSAGYGQPGKFLEDKIKTISLNTLSTIKLFQKLNKKGKFLFVSTSELYSGIESENIKEEQIGTTNTNHPRSCYIEGKRCGESICNSYYEQGYDVKILRLSLAYGPGTKINDKRVLNSLIEKGLKNDYIELMDQGDAIRTYCYITDVIEMFWNIILFGKKVTYNVGGNSKTTILNLAKIIGKELNKEVILPKKTITLEGNPKIVNISIESYVNEFGKPNFISLDEGIKKTINWQKKIYEKNYVS
jgi:UDP-glucuronate decarboxylase